MSQYSYDQFFKTGFQNLEKFKKHRQERLSKEQPSQNIKKSEKKTEKKTNMLIDPDEYNKFILQKKFNKVHFLNTTYKNFEDVEWSSSNKLTYNKHVNNRDCIIVIPIYDYMMSELEVKSVKRCVDLFKNKYEICIVCQDNFNISESPLRNIKYNFSIFKINHEFFYNRKTYSWMCEQWKFYDAFKNWKYMLIYQTDAWVFKDELEKFLKLDYDYIGGPWLKKQLTGWTKEEYQKIKNFDDLLPKYCVGNGGLSLRKISKFASVCKSTDFSSTGKLKKSRVDFEDLAFCIDLHDKFKFAPVEVAMNFSIDNYTEYWLLQLKGKLPMGCHGWFKKDRYHIWKELIK